MNDSKNFPKVGIATDGAHSTKQGRTRYRGVDLATGTILFSAEAGNRTANVGEFLGVVSAARYIIQHEFIPQTIYTDSTTAISWYHSGKAATRRHCPALVHAEVFLRLMAVPLANIEVRHWDTPNWGEIPADYGEK